MNFIIAFLGLNAPKDAEYERRKKVGRRALFAYLIIYSLLLGVSLVNSISNQLSLNFALGFNFALGLNVVAAVIALRFNQTEKPYLGTWTVIIAAAIGSIVTAILSPIAIAQAIMLAAIQLLLIIGVALLSLPARSADWAIGFTLMGQFIHVLIESAQTVREQPSEATLTTSLVVVVVSWMVGLGFIIRNYASYPLRTKLIFSFMTVTLIPLILLGTFNTYSASQTLKASSTSDLQKAAQLTQFTIDEFIATQLDSVRTEAQIKDFVDFLEFPTTQRSNSALEQRARQVLQSLGRRDLVFLTSISVLDKRGLNVLDTDENLIGNYEGDQTYFEEAVKRGLPYVSQMLFSTSNQEPDLYFSAPIRNSHAEIIGVLRMKYNGAVVQNLIINAVPPKNNDDPLYIVVIDRENLIRLAHTTHPQFLYTTYKQLSSKETRRLIALKLLPGGVSDTHSFPQKEVVLNNEDLKKGTAQTYVASAVAESGDDATTVALGLERVPWVVIAQQSTFAVQQPVFEQTRRTVQIALLMAALAVGAAFFVSQLLASPVVQLTSVTKAIAAGDLSIRAKIEAPDEIGELATEINRTTNLLQTTLQGLEQRVSDRTAELQLRSEELAQQTHELEKRSLELEQANLRTERRASQLEAISQVSNVVAALRDPEALLPQVAQLISQRFGFYHVGIFLLDANNQYAVLRATNSAGGERMLARGHQLPVGKVGLVGNVSASGQARIALDTGEDAVFFNNPDLPETHSEIALPLKARDKVIGVLDVQSTEPNAFSEDDIQVLSTLSDQVSIAIENARLFQETSKSLAEVETLYRRYIGTQWQRITEGQQTSGFHSTAAGVMPLAKPVERPEYSETLTTGNTVIRLDEEEMSSLVVPIKIRGQTLGVVNLRHPGQKTWSEDEINLVQAIAERASISAENARLFEQTTERAERERKVSEITSKIRSTNDPNEMMQIALNEIKQALNIKDARIVPFTPPQAKDEG